MKRLSAFLVLIGAAILGVVLAASVATASRKSAPVYETMVIVGHVLGQKGADGLTHDTTYGANFSVKVGQKVIVTVYNFDEGPHTITAQALGLNVKIPGATNEEKGVPSKTIFTFTPKKAGKVRWYCALPCDAGQNFWAMARTSAGPARNGYMAGYITVTA